MSEKRFLETLQALLTMVNPDSISSSAMVKAALENLLALAVDSGKCDEMVIRMIETAIATADRLIRYRDDFVSKPGQYHANVARRDQLRLVIRPGC